MNMKIICSLLFLLCSTLLTAQESVNTSGGGAQSATGSVAFSVGQVVYTYHQGSGGSVAQGVQQPYKIEPSGLQDENSAIQLSVYPNPTQDIVYLEIKEFQNTRIQYQLYTIDGGLIEEKTALSSMNEINLLAFPSAAYVLRVTDEKNKIIKSYKISKN